MVQQVSKKISEFDAAATGPGPYVTVGNSGGTTYRFPASLQAIDPCSEAFGARGDGVSDDRGALLLAIAAGVLTGRPVCGFGRTYGIAGNLTLVENAWLQDISFVQLTPSGSTRRTLTSAGGDNICLVRVTVDRNGTGEFGVHQQTAGVYIDGGSGHYFEDVEVFGDDIGGGFFLYNATDCDLVRVHAHDINYLLASDPGNDRVMGIYLNTCTRIRLTNCDAHDIGGDYGGGYTLRWSRGFGFSGTTDVQMIGCRVWMVDQGSDMTGQFNSRFLFDGCYAGYCLTWGFKFANSCFEGQVVNCIAERTHLSGFVASGPSGVTLYTPTSNITFVGCTAYDTGYVGLPGDPVPGDKTAFRVQNGGGGFSPDTTLGIRFIGCKAIDTQAVPTLEFGFDSDIAAPTDGNYTEAINCVSIGHTSDAFVGMHQSRCEVGLSSAQSIPNDTWTPVEWTSETDYGAMHDVSTNNDNVFARRDGAYRTTFGVTFQDNNTGQRGVRILRDGGVINGAIVVIPANAAGATSLSVTWSSSLVDAGTSFRIEVLQDSGIALNLLTTSAGIVEQVG